MKSSCALLCATVKFTFEYQPIAFLFRIDSRVPYDPWMGFYIKKETNIRIGTLKNIKIIMKNKQKSERSIEISMLRLGEKRLYGLRVDY